MSHQESEAFKNARRQFLKGSAALLAGAAIEPASLVEAAAARSGSLIKRENEKPGARDWQLTRVRLDKEGFRSTWIEGYCSRQSLLAGETVDIMVSASPARKLHLEVFRLGYYGGRGARLMADLGILSARTQPTPQPGDKNLHECRWETTTQLKIPADWPSGVYLGRMTTIPESKAEAYWQSYVVFIVRDERPADILFQCSDNTWQAYNRWPNNYSVYTHPKGGQGPWAEVSFDRPYGREAQHEDIVNDPLTVGAGEFLPFEFPLAYWLEEHGYDVTYCSNSDCLDAAQITRCRTMLSVGHDEYWDVRQYDAVKSAIAAGVNVLWLCGNSVFGVTPFSPAADGRANRVLTRTGIFGGLTDAEVNEQKSVFTEQWKRSGPDESLLIGARSIVPFNGGGDWICTRPEHWIFAGTGMKKGEAIPGLVG